MPPLSEMILPMVEKTRGRCHSCAHQKEYSFPTGSKYMCNGFHIELMPEDRRDVRNCPRWTPWRSVDQEAREKYSHNPLIKDLIEQEDRLFWFLKSALDEQGIDIKTLMVLSQSSISSVKQVKWIDTLESRFSDETPPVMIDLLSQLRLLGYDALCQLVEQLGEK